MQRVKHNIHRTYHAGRHHARRIHAHPAGLPVLVFVLLILISGVTLVVASRKGVVANFVARDHTITIVSYDSNRRIVPTKAKTVGELLHNLDVQLTEGDRVEPSLDALITQDNFLVNVYRSVPVAIHDGVNMTLTHSAGATPRSIVAQSGMPLYNEDAVRAEPTHNFVLQRSLGHQVVIDRATPIYLALYGTQLTIHTQTNTVADLLKEKNVKLGKDDTVKPALATTLTPNMQVAVVRNGIQVITVNEDVPAPVQNVIDMSLSFGSQAVRQEGSPGKIVKTYQVNIQNGEEVGRVLLQSVTTVQPVTRIVAKGNTVNIPADKQSVMAAAGISPSDYAYVDYVFSRESRWNAAAVNAGGCSGLGQACPGSKLAAACPNWQTDAVCQTKFFTGYAVGRYGSWQGAYNAWISKHWW